MDPGLFAEIIPQGNRQNAWKAIQRRENRHLFVPGVEHDTGRSSRQTTLGMLLEDAQDESTNIYYDHLALRFDDDPPLKDPAEGWQFGYSSQASDAVICLENTVAVSRRHFTIGLTDDFRIQFHQKTAQSTRVSFVSKPGHEHTVHPKQGQKFIISLAPWEPLHWHSIGIGLSSPPDVLNFRITFPNHTKEAPQAYYDNMRQWLQTKASALPPVLGLGLDSTASTVAPSRQPPTPPRFGTLSYQRVIGSGAFGVVELMVDLTTGDVVARKRFIKLSDEAARQDASSGRARDMAKVLNEVRLLQQNPHPNIVQMLAFQQEPVPSILMPYYQLGNIEGIPLEFNQHLSAFRQLLIVLDYLHGRNVAHRDLKPENILVASVDPVRIAVSDFGLSKEAVPGTPMTTFCGTRLYAAPDIFPSHQRVRSTLGYWVSVDIWSAGVILLEWAFGRPSVGRMGQAPPAEWIRFWTRTLLGEVVKRDREDPGNPVVDLLKHMLDPDPATRYPARACLDRGCVNGLFKRARSGDVIDADADDPADSAAKTPTQTEPPSRLEDSKTSSQGVDDARASAAQAPDGGGGQGSSSSASTWQRFLDFDRLPACPVDEASSTPGALATVAEALPSESQPAPEPRPATGAGQKRRRHTGRAPASTASSSSVSSKAKAPSSKKRGPANVGYDSAARSDVLG